MLDLIDPLELLAQDALIPANFTFGAKALGSSLDQGSASHDLAPGTQVSVPLWMVKSLERRSLVRTTLPAVYSERYRRKLNAGAECVSLKNLAPYFYEVGHQLNEVLFDVELSTFLSRTFKTRYHELVSKGLNSMTGEDVLKLSSKLSVEEQQLFEGGRISIMSMDGWWRGEGPVALKPNTQHPIFKRVASDTLQGGDQDSNKQARR